MLLLISFRLLTYSALNHLAVGSGMFFFKSLLNWFEALVGAVLHSVLSYLSTFLSRICVAVLTIFRLRVLHLLTLSFANFNSFSVNDGQLL